jgi:hypothetical protein
MLEEAVVAVFKVVLEETTNNLRLVEVPVPVEILTGPSRVRPLAR